jgi:hypothetical protein
MARSTSESSSDVMLLAGKLDIKLVRKSGKPVENASSRSGALDVAESVRAREIIDSAARHKPGSAWEDLFNANVFTRFPLVRTQLENPATVSSDGEFLIRNTTFRQGSQQDMAALQALETCMTLHAIVGCES